MNKLHSVVFSREFWLAMMALCLFFLTGTNGQVSFERTGQVFLITQNPNELVEFNVTPGANSLNSTTLAPSPSASLNALGFRKTDNLLYGISTSNNHLHQGDASGSLQDLGPLPLNNSLVYLAGDVSPDGQFLYSIGSLPNGNDAELARTDLSDPGFGTDIIQLIGIWQIVDFAFAPFGNGCFGYDKLSRQVVSINISNGLVTPLGLIEQENEIEGLYFDAFGDLYAVGRSVFGIVNALFVIDKLSGKEKRLATGPVQVIDDAASCPYSVEMKYATDVNSTLSCSELLATYTIANGTGQALSGIDFVQGLPSGFFVDQIVQNPFGVSIDSVSQPGTFRFNNINLPTGTRELKVKLLINDISANSYGSQARLEDLPILFGSECHSDNPATGGFEDSTRVEITTYDNDTLAYAWFICLGESLTLDGSEFGNNIIWNSGANTPTIDVTTGGIYSLAVSTRCETFEITHDVTSASCPYTISIGHEFEPDTIFPCNDVTVRYILNNSSGEPRYNLSILDTLPTEFSFSSILIGPIGMNQKPNLPPNIICLEGINMNIGKDTIDVLVSVGAVQPGTITNRALLKDLPQVMGPIRISDYLETPFNDATPLVIKGSLGDSTFYDTVVCENATLLLDASKIAEDYEWQDGSSNPIFEVKEPGNYELTVYDGCAPTTIIWRIGKGKQISIQLANTDSIHQGAFLELLPIIMNQGDSLSMLWTGEALSCTACQSPTVQPFQNTFYNFMASNEVCSDTATIKVIVDESRRIYAPTAFSPNFDGVNDFFFLQSPDFGNIKRLLLFDRWGGLVYDSVQSKMNIETSGWDGTSKGVSVSAGIYTWMAEVQFIDGKTGLFNGSFTILK